MGFTRVGKSLKTVENMTFSHFFTRVYFGTKKKRTKLWVAQCSNKKKEHGFNNPSKGTNWMKPQTVGEVGVCGWGGSVGWDGWVGECGVVGGRVGGWLSSGDWVGWGGWGDLEFSAVFGPNNSC